MAIPDVDDLVNAAITKFDNAAQIANDVANLGVGDYVDSNSGPIPSLLEWQRIHSDELGNLPAIIEQIDALSSFNADLQSASDPAKGISIVPTAVVSVSSMAALLNQRRSSSLTYLLQAFSPGGDQDGGKFKWVASIPRTNHNGFSIISPTVPFDGLDANIVPFLQGVGETAIAENGCFVRIYSGPIHAEWAGANGTIDCAPIFQHLIDKTLTTENSIIANKSYILGSGIVMHAYRTPSAPVYKDFNRVPLSINKAIYTGTSGVAISAMGPVARLSINRLIGPGTAAGFTEGVQVSGFGDASHSIGWVTGFTNDVHVKEAYGQNITCSWWSGDCIRGVAWTDANACKIYGGRIGGGFSGSAVDPESPEIGVDLGVGCSNNEIHSNIEYCRRSPTARGYQDLGSANKFYGYIESCAAYNMLANGKDGNHEVLAGGTNLIDEQAAFYANDTNHIHLLTPIDYFNETPTGANSGLRFIANQSIGFGNSGKISAPRGLLSFQRRTNTYRNEILDSSNLAGASWVNTVQGSASWASVTVAESSVTMPEHGLIYATRLTFPAVVDEEAIYIKSQTITLANGPVSHGVFAYCESGEVEIYVRVLGSGKQARTHYKLVESSGYIRIQSRITNNQGTDVAGTYQLQFRSKKGGVVHIMAAHSVNYPDVNIPVVNIGGIHRKSIPGAEVNGKTFYNGLNINGRVRHCPSPVVFGSAPLTLTNASREYSWYVIGALNANIFLEPGEDGDEILITRTSAASTGCNLLGSSTTFSGLASLNLTAAYAKVLLRYSAAAAESGEWLIVHQ